MRRQLVVFVVALALCTIAAGGGPFDASAHPPRPTVKVPFPPIKDWSSLRIRLERTMCYGTCPVYSVEIAGDGTVTFVGTHFVETKGTQTAKIDGAKVRALYQAFADADFFWTFDSYNAAITDMPSHIVSITFDRYSKKIVDYAGGMVAMPKAIGDLETAIDEAAGTMAWIGHTREP